MKQGDGVAIALLFVWYDAKMKKQVIFISGGDSFNKREDFLAYLRTTPLREPLGDRTVRWPDTLRSELGEDYEVYLPTMPNKFNARYDEWAIWLERHLDLVEDGVILIGWSLGGMFLAKYLSETPLKKQVSAAYLLAAPGGEFVDGSGGGGDCVDFRPLATAVAKLGTLIPHLEIWQSEDDFVVPVTEVEWYRTHIPEAKITIFKDKNHFLVESLPELIAAIKKTESN